MKNLKIVLVPTKPNKYVTKIQLTGDQKTVHYRMKNFVTLEKRVHNINMVVETVETY